jgi:hypothetical protein
MQITFSFNNFFILFSIPNMLPLNYLHKAMISLLPYVCRKSALFNKEFAESNGQGKEKIFLTSKDNRIENRTGLLCSLQCQSSGRGENILKI